MFIIVPLFLRFHHIGKFTAAVNYAVKIQPDNCVYFVDCLFCHFFNGNSAAGIVYKHVRFAVFFAYEVYKIVQREKTNGTAGYMQLYRLSDRELRALCYGAWGVYVWIRTCKV